MNNYAAVLLDLGRNAEALALLKTSTAEISEYCSNYAIAIATSAYDINEIRKWNQKAQGYPKVKHAIVAYVDWMGF